MGAQKMNYNITPIPTKYKGRLYRSRLESKWACMFDLLQWRYDYEPIDLNGWQPDFIIYGEEELLVEIKPFSTFAEFDLIKIKNAVENTCKQSSNILLLGNRIFSELEQSFNETNNPSIGWLGENGNFWGDAIITQSKNKWGLSHGLLLGKDKIIPNYQKSPKFEYLNFQIILTLWNEAGEVVQWNKPTFIPTISKREHKPKNNIPGIYEIDDFHEEFMEIYNNQEYKKKLDSEHKIKKYIKKLYWEATGRYLTEQEYDLGFWRLYIKTI